MSILSYQTLDDGTLVDYELDERTQHITIRAGRSLTPEQRSVLVALTPFDAVAMMRHLQDLYTASPINIGFQEALAMHRRGATHDCGEWKWKGICRLCERQLTAKPEQP